MTFIYGEQLNSIQWEIYQNNNFDKLKFISFQNEGIERISEIILQNSLFDDDFIFCIDITKLNLKDKKSISLLKNIASSDLKIILYALNKNYKINDLSLLIAPKKFSFKKVFNLNETDCHKMINSILLKKNLKLDIKVQLALEKKLPPDYQIISGEIEKLSLLQREITIDDINIIVFDHFSANIFMIVQLLLKKKYTDLIKTINNLLIKSNNVTELISVLSQQLFQLKLYLIAVKNKWDFNLINTRYQISYFVQKIYSEMLYNNNENKIDVLLNDLYDLDLKIKTKEIEPYSGLINVLLKEKLWN